MCIAIGQNAGQNNQGQRSVAMGDGAGTFSQGQFSAMLGHLAGHTCSENNSICLNGSGTILNPANQGFYVNPVRNDNINNTNIVRYIQLFQLDI